jgi:alginate O-acetyltransferase complex protein AlgJ
MRWPMLLAAALLLLPSAMLAAGMRAGPLFGVQVAAPAPLLTTGALWSGAFQREARAWFGQIDPALPTAVAARNQAYFSLLHQSAMPDIVIGRGLELLETVTLDTFCHRDMAALPPQAEIAASRLAAMQAWYAARGRVFVYLLTPNKIGRNPGFLPKGWPCLGAAAARDHLLAQWRDILHRHGIRFVDGPAIIAAAQDDASQGSAAGAPLAGATALFPRGGTHWNWIGASLATQAFVSTVNQARPGSLTPFSFTWHDAPPSGTDRDLTDLLNLPYPRLDYLAPVVDLIASAPQPCRAPFIAEVGGSFVFHIDFLLARLPCPPLIALYTYFQVERASFAPFTRVPADPAQRRTELLDAADIVVLEENEDIVFHARHADQLWSLIQDRRVGP